MKDTNKYRLVFGRLQNKPFETREGIVNWIAKNGTLQIKRITFNNKDGKGRTGWVDTKTLLELWKDVEKKLKSPLVLIFILSTVACVVAGCASSTVPQLNHASQSVTTGQSSEDNSGPTLSQNTNITSDPLSLTNRYGLSLRDAEDKSLKLMPGMTQDEVLVLLGKPDETSAGTYGTQTQTPWNGITWQYHWIIQDPMSADTTLSSAKRNLSIIFEKAQDNFWVINSWNWY